jgi:hypothetical protein
VFWDGGWGSGGALIPRPAPGGKFLQNFSWRAGFLPDFAVDPRGLRPKLADDMSAPGAKVNVCALISNIMDFFPC